MSAELTGKWARLRAWVCMGGDDTATRDGRAGVFLGPSGLTKHTIAGAPSGGGGGGGGVGACEVRGEPELPHVTVVHKGGRTPKAEMCMAQPMSQ